MREEPRMIQPFGNIFNHRYQEAEEVKKRGRKIMGYMCIYVPEEIIYAAGMLPLRLFGGEAKTTAAADACLYTNICSFVRSCLEETLKGKYSFLEGFVTCNNCDHNRRFFDAWVQFIKTPFTQIISLPFNISQGSLSFYTEELKRFKKGLEDHFGIRITNEDLLRAIEVYDQTRALLKKLYQLRASDYPPISGAETLEVVRAGMIMDKERYNRLLEELLENIPNKPKPANHRPRLLISGAELDNPQYIQIIEDLGGLVVADDLCVGSRYFWDPVETPGDPIEALARRYLTHAPCPRMNPAEGRVRHLEKMVKDFRVNGIIYQTIKFCDLYETHFPLARDVLNSLNIPVLALEREYQLEGMGQMRTRVQAFLESISV